MAEVSLVDVSKRFGAVEAVRGLSLSIADGEFVVLLGPTGAGKTTALRLIAGLERPDAGSVLIRGRDVTKDVPAERDVAFVFQQYSLYPHLTVYDNLAFPLRSPARRMDESFIRRRVRQVAELLHIEKKLDNRATALSGGEMQRVAIGRALVREPAVYLMDEPLSSLDAKLRAELRLELKRIQRELGTTILYVTHDQIEAMTMADRIVVMHDGLVEQIGAPLELYDRPQNLFVAGFIGSPAMNLLNGTIRANGRLEFESEKGIRLPLATAPRNSDGQLVIYGIRPEHFLLADDGAEAEVQVVEPTGSELQIAAKLGGADIIAVFRERHNFKPGEKIRLKPDPRLAHLFDAPSGKRLNA